MVKKKKDRNELSIFSRCNWEKTTDNFLIVFPMAKARVKGYTLLEVMDKNQ